MPVRSGRHRARGGLSGPIHDKGVLILKHCLASLFARNTPLALNAAIVFEQEYHGIEDSASPAPENSTPCSPRSPGCRSARGWR